MADLRPAYLIHGDDHGAIVERRARLRALAENDGGAAALDVLDGDAATPAGVAAALAAMTLALGRRVIIVDGVERWRDADVVAHVAPALAAMPPQTTLALFAREEARTKAPAPLHDAVTAAGGQVVAHMTVKPWELARWVREQAGRLGLELDAAAAKALVAQVGERQQRLLRELEKLALEGPAATVQAPRRVSADEVEERAARSAERRTFALADDVVGARREQALRTYVRLRAQGERPAGLVYVLAGRLRDALAIAARLRAGEPVADVRRGLRMPQRAAERLVADVAGREPERLSASVSELAQLELDSRGGAPIPASRSRISALDEDTLAVRAIEAMTS